MYTFRSRESPRDISACSTGVDTVQDTSLGLLPGSTSHLNPFPALRTSYGILGRALPIWLPDINNILLELSLSAQRFLSDFDHLMSHSILLELTLCTFSLQGRYLQMNASRSLNLCLRQFPEGIKTCSTRSSAGKGLNKFPTDKRLYPLLLTGIPSKDVSWPENKPPNRGLQDLHHACGLRVILLSQYSCSWKYILLETWALQSATTLIHSSSVKGRKGQLMM